MRKQMNVWGKWLLVGVLLFGMLGFVPAADAAVTEGDILNHAVIPTDKEVASSKYAVIAQFGAKSKLVLTGATTKKSNIGNNLIIEPTDSQKGKIKALYTNIGSYQGRSLDFEFVVSDWVKAGFLGGEYMFFKDTEIGFSQGGYEYVSLKGTYKYTDTGKAATDLTGSYMTVNDLDANQFMAFDAAMMKKIDKIYAFQNSRVSYWTKGEKTNIGARYYDDIETDDDVGIVTFLASGHTFNFEWHKDWSRPSTLGNPYKFTKTVQSLEEANVQSFSYITEKPVRTEILDPTKKIIDAKGEQLDENVITSPDKFSYEVYHNTPAEYEKFYYKSYIMEDVIHGAFSVDQVKVYDSANKDVTTRFTVTTNGQTVKAAAKTSALTNKTFYGQDYRFVIDVTAEPTKKYLEYANGSDRFTATNTAMITIDGGLKSTNQVKTVVKLPRTDLKMKKMQIYTNHADVGLPVRLDVTAGDNTALYPDDTVKIELYEVQGEKRTKVAEKSVKLKDIGKTMELTIPSSKLAKDTRRNYEAVIADYDKNHMTVSDTHKAIDTDGVTSKQGVIKDSQTFTGVVLTEREMGKDMKEYKETIKVNYKVTPRVKAGYAIEVTADGAYTNEKMSETADIVGFEHKLDAMVSADHSLIDTSLSYYNPNKKYAKGDRIYIDLLKKNETSMATSYKTAYQLPKIFLEQPSGFTFTEQQKAAGKIKGTAVAAGNKLLVPVWIDELGKYKLSYETLDPIGAHFMEINIEGIVDVYAYMFHHLDSKTADQDEILITPWTKGSDSEDW